MTKIIPAEELRFLRKRIGDVEWQKLSYNHDPSLQKRANNVENTVLHSMQGRKVGEPFCGADDIIKGVARLDHHSESREDRNIPLSTTRIYSILQTMEMINTREVCNLTSLKPRQARRYVKACEIIIPFLQEYFDRGEDLLIDIENYYEDVE